MHYKENDKTIIIKSEQCIIQNFYSKNKHLKIKLIENILTYTQKK